MHLFFIYLTLYPHSLCLQTPSMTTTTTLSSDPMTSNPPIAFNQINAQRAQLLAAVAATGGGCSSTVISPSSSIMGSLGGGGKPLPLGLGGTIIGSPTSLSSTATLAAHLQPAHSSGGGVSSGTLPPGLGSGGGYILNAYASGRLHHPLQQTGGVGHTATLNRHQHHHHHNNHHHQQAQQPHPGSGSSLLLGSMGSVMGVGVTSTTTTSCNSSQDLDDNININAIKDCLMTQRVPESCV